MAAAHDRAVRNETIFREINERIREVSAHWAAADAVTFVCECSRADCVETLSLALEEYADVRSHPLRFVVAPGHVEPTGERVVRTEAGRYAIVEKTADTESFRPPDPTE